MSPETPPPPPSADVEQLEEIERHAILQALKKHDFNRTETARALGISRPTVYAYVRRDTPPGPKRPQWRASAGVLTPYMPYLIRRWRESRADSVQLTCR